ncbi:Mce protein [Mycobacterium sp. 050272]|uniref:Mce protein n=1 Tax=Mycobacterium sp. 050272 TaxID=3142488 RepID=UPI00318C2701
MADDADTAGQLRTTGRTSTLIPDEHGDFSPIGPDPTHDGDAGIADDSTAPDGEDTPTAPPDEPKATRSPLRAAMLVGVTAIAALATLAGWLGFRLHHLQQAQTQRNVYVQVGKQAALNLTTIDWQHADDDVRRIIDGATGQFYDDFTKRSQPFIAVVKQTKSTTVGTVTEAALESETAGTAQVLVAVSVKTSNAEVPDQQPRAWRMRISVQQVGDQAKVSNVEFVP